MTSDYINGYIQRSQGGAYNGTVTIDGVRLHTISAVYFKQDNENYLWLKRKKILEFDDKSCTYRERDARPQWEVYMKKQIDGSTIAYKGEFFFMHFRYSIVGIWDSVLGKEKQRLNLYVERLPMEKQTIINNINEHKRNDGGKH